MDIRGTVTELTDALVSHADIRSASTDPAMVNVPGVLVQIESLNPDLLEGWTMRVRCLLISPDTDPVRCMDTLSVLLTAADDVLGRPADRVQAGTVILPDNPTPLPALIYPIDLYPTD